MTKLWQKDYELDALIEQFTVGNDPLLDQKLVVYDCMGSIAHAQMLQRIGILTEQECALLKKSLQEIIKQAQAGNFIIEQADEDVHTAVEQYLTKQLGDLGKKIHTARSRNDQVALDMRLYLRDELLSTTQEVVKASQQLLAQANTYKDVPIPGRTHFQRAMPSSLGLLFGAYAESLLDTVILLQAAYELIDQSPLGSAAGYGVMLPIDRQLVADLLGFAKVQNNVVYVSNSRGKMESVVMQALAQLMVDLSKLSADLIMLSMPEFGYIEIPKELCSGSSLMPQKRNPCALELVRAKSAGVISELMQVFMIIRGLPSGYHRDFQETKEPCMRSCTTTAQALQIITHTIGKIKVNKQACIASFSSELFATDQALLLAQQGIPFRDAYKQVGLSLDNVALEDPVANIQQKTHQGASGNLNLALSEARCTQYCAWIEQKQTSYKCALQALAGEDDGD